jgi:hypothetical protein
MTGLAVLTPKRIFIIRPYNGSSPAEDITRAALLANSRAIAVSLVFSFATQMLALNKMLGNFNRRFVLFYIQHQGVPNFVINLSRT